MRILFPTLLYITLLLSTLASTKEVKEENSQTVADNNNTGGNQSAEQSGEETPTEVDNPSSENENEDNTKENAKNENQNEVAEANADEESNENEEDIEKESEHDNGQENEQENDQETEQETKESETGVNPRMGIVKEMNYNGYSSEEKATSVDSVPEGPAPCTCGIFLSSQFKKGSKDQPKGLPVLEQEIDTPFMDNAIGNRHCMHRCLEVIIKHLPKSNEIICATVDKDHVHREKAYLFIKNHAHKWLETKMSAGREFCCKNNLPYKCNKSKRSILTLLRR